ncbi:NAP domain-containing protein/NAD_binding_2 domain-containing protein [Cephalotus follicularis]|uniref:NAP domain-containing protein/NAD_binding_2 domain-containing protein n=1 Tax=Cephalotus follicularis TaxID=3775 RepID=A0A1Q3DEU9_CEPFO|nr:NAP domain-containing protein/NAD_binding_2 domain-containing protein [Cephalotus follicularis]
MGTTSLVKITCCHHLLSSSTTMAMRSSFCPQIPIHFRARPITSSHTRLLLSLSFRAFASQASNAPAKDEFPARVGFLGLGIMGAPMAENLLKAGCDVTVWNRTKSKCDPLINLGAKYRSSPEEVAAFCSVTFAMLADPESAVEVACGKHGAVSGMGSGKGYVDVSTVDGPTSKLISEHFKATGASFLEAPVSGSKKPAEEGQLIFLTAGDKALYETVSPLLDIMGKSRFYLGDVGNGAAMKLVVNMIMGSMMASFSEGLVLGEKLGLDPSVLVEVVSQAAISAPMYKLKGPSMVQSLYPTSFPLKHQQKDLRLALGLAESVSQSTPIAAAANELYKVAKSHGLSDHDFSAVMEALKVKTLTALSAEDRADLVNALKNKLQSLAGQHSDILQTLSPTVRKRVEVLREIQSQYDLLEREFFEERATLEAKYQKLYEPLYSKRYEIVNGIVEVEGITNEAAVDQGGDTYTEEKGVPDFWLNAMKTNEILAEEIPERDEGALKFLKDIKWYRLEDPKGFKLEFYFNSNPYFKNSVLTKTYHVVDDDDDPILERAIGTQIEWYPGKSLTQKLLKKKPRKGAKNNTPITKTEKCESFFNFFNPPQLPEDDDDIDVDIVEELQDLMEQDYNIGTTIRDKIIPHAVSWFTGEAVQGDEYGGIDEEEEEEDEEEDDDDDDEEEEEEDDEEEEEEVVKGRRKPSAIPKRSGKTQARNPQQGENPPECKQQ